MAWWQARCHTSRSLAALNTTALKKTLNTLLHWGYYLAAAFVIVTCCIALYLRAVVMPEIDSYRPRIEAFASEALQRPVHIGRIGADWHGVNPRFSLTDLVIGEVNGEHLRLPRADATLSWLSLILFEPRLARLDLARLDLDAWRDTEGRIFVAGMQVNGPDQDTALPDWLLRQHDIRIHDGRLQWYDRRTAAVPLILDGLRLRSVNLAGWHRLGLVVHPPAELGSRLDLRASLRGNSVGALTSWRGEIFARLDGTDTAALQGRLSWPRDTLREGHGDIRLWADVRQGRLSAVEGDVRLQDILINLDAQLRDVAFDRLTGHIGWQERDGRRTLSAQRFSFSLPGQAPSEPADLRFSYLPATGHPFADSEFSAHNLRIEAFTALADHLPLSAEIRDGLAAYQPRGLIDFAEVSWLDRQHYRVKARFRQLVCNTRGAIPGIGPLDGQLDAEPKGGSAKLAGTGLGLNYPNVFAESLLFDRLHADLTWKAKEDRIDLNIASLDVNNREIEGKLSGHLVLQPNHAPVADLRAQIVRGEGSAVWRYLPRAAGTEVQAWLRDSIKRGQSRDTRMILKGPLNQFPFDQGGGEFKVTVPIDGGMLEFAHDWPAIHAIRGQLVFQGKRMEIEAQAAQIGNVGLQGVRAVIPDLMQPHTDLYIDGQSSGSLQGFLDYVRQSPVLGYTHHVTESIRAQGPAALRLYLHLPLHALERSVVKGSLKLDRVNLNPGHAMPALEKLSGVLHFTEQGMQAQGMQATLLGQPAVIDIRDQEGGARIQVRGRLPASALKEWLPDTLARKMTGSAAFNVDISARGTAPEWRLTSSLEGLGINLPEPFEKTARTPLALDLVNTPGANDTTLLRLKLADRATVQAQIPSDTRNARIGVRIGGGQAALPTRPGIFIHADSDRIDLDAWQALTNGSGQGVRSGPELREIQIRARTLVAGERSFRNMQLTLMPQGESDLWKADFKGTDSEGWMRFRNTPHAHVEAHLSYLRLPDSVASAASRTEGTNRPFSGDIHIDTLQFSDGRPLGKLTMKLDATPGQWRIRQLDLDSGESTLHASGAVTRQGRGQSQIEIKLDSKNLGKLLERIGQSGKIRQGAAHLEGTLDWPGPLDNLAVSRLNGELQVDIRRGQFLKMEPGAGRLIGIFSLQSLPRRITLDFRDVFSEGFAFESLTGKLILDEGMMTLPDLRMDGPAAKVSLNGLINLVTESQDLKVVVEPHLDETVAVAGGLLGGPAVMLGAYVASKLLNDPFGKAGRFEYAVTGTWADPLVRTTQRAPQPAQAPGIFAPAN